MTKIPSTQELIKLVYSPDVSFDDMLEAAIDIHRTALLTELRDSGLLEEDKNIDGSDMKYHFRNGQNSKAKAIKAYIRTLLE